MLETYARLDPRRQAEFERLFQLRRKRTKHLLRLRELDRDVGRRPGRSAARPRRGPERSVERPERACPAGPYRHLLERLAVRRRRPTVVGGGLGSPERVSARPATLPSVRRSNERYISRRRARSPRDGSDEQARNRLGAAARTASGSSSTGSRPPGSRPPVRPRLPIGVAVVSAVIAIFAVIMLLAGLLFVLNAYFGMSSRRPSRSSSRSTSLGAAILVVLGAGLLSIATALWHQETWALWTTVDPRLRDDRLPVLHRVDHGPVRGLRGPAGVPARGSAILLLTRLLLGQLAPARADPERNLARLEAAVKAPARAISPSFPSCSSRATPSGTACTPSPCGTSDRTTQSLRRIARETNTALLVGAPLALGRAAWRGRERRAPRASRGPGVETEQALPSELRAVRGGARVHPDQREPPVRRRRPSGRGRDLLRRVLPGGRPRPCPRGRRAARSTSRPRP